MDETEMWQRWHDQRDEQARAWLIEFYKPLVDQAVRSFRNVRRSDVEDLRGWGYLGLCEAVSTWDPARTPWLGFARFRIRAKMVDGIRDMSWVPKSVRTRAREIERAEDDLSGKLGRQPTTAELAEAFGCGVEEMEESIASIRATDWNVASLDNTEDGCGPWLDAIADPTSDTEQAFARRERARMLRSILDRLPSRLRWVLEQRYFDGRTQKAVAAELGVHESRVSQLLEEAFARARQLAHERPLTLTTGDGL